jgi:tetratricopeptide (TPR) repeat protein
MLDVMARVYRALGIYKRAEPMHREAVRLRARTLGDGHPLTLQARHHLAYLLDQMGQDEEAESLYRAVLAARRASGDPDGLVESTSDLAGMLYAAERYDETEALAREGLAVLDRHPDAGPMSQGGALSRASVLYLLGKARAQRGAPAEGERLVRQAHRIYTEELGPEHVYTMSVETGLARMLAAEGRFDEADGHLRHAFKVFEGVWGPDHPWTINAMVQRAAVFAQAGRRAEARRLLRDALARGEASPEPDEGTLADLRQRLATLEEASAR